MIKFYIGRRLLKIVLEYSCIIDDSTRITRASRDFKSFWKYSCYNNVLLNINGYISVAKMFNESTKSSDWIPVLLVYNFPQIYDTSICLFHISKRFPCISTFKTKQEVLFLPETLFEVTKRNFTKHINETYNFLHANFSYSLILDVHMVQQVNFDGPIYRILHQKSCPRATFPTEEWPSWFQLFCFRLFLF